MNTCACQQSQTMLPVGAENTKTKRLTAPDISGFSLSTAFAGGSTEYKTRKGNTCWPSWFGFFSHPVLSFLTVAESAHLTHITPPLKRRRTKKGSLAMFSAPTFPCTQKSRCMMNTCTHKQSQTKLNLGAENTKRRLTAPVISGFCLPTALCREWTGIQHPSGEYRPAVLLQFFSSPTSIFSAGHQKKDTQRSHTRPEKAPRERQSCHVFGTHISVHPESRCMMNTCACQQSQTMLPVGAHNTIHSGLPRSRESGFFVSACANRPGSVLAIQDPLGESGRPDCVQVVKYPALARPHKTRQSLSQNLHSFFGEPHVSIPMHSSQSRRCKMKRFTHITISIALYLGALAALVSINPDTGALHTLVHLIVVLTCSIGAVVAICSLPEKHQPQPHNQTKLPPTYRDLRSKNTRRAHSML